MSERTDYEPTDAFGFYRSYTRHIAFVRSALALVTEALTQRGLVHDASKLLDDEFAGFCNINAAARVNKFGSPEYSEAMKRDRATIDLHFRRNSHHAEFPSYPENEGKALTFLDVIEMVCDWHGARAGYDDSRPWKDSVALNFKAKGHLLSPEQRWLAEQVADFLDRSPAGGARE